MHKPRLEQSFNGSGLVCQHSFCATEVGAPIVLIAISSFALLTSMCEVEDPAVTTKAIGQMVMSGPTPL